MLLPVPVSYLFVVSLDVFCERVLDLECLVAAGVVAHPGSVVGVDGGLVVAQVGVEAEHLRAVVALDVGLGNLRKQ